MSDNVYKLIDVVGSSKVSVEDAVQQAIARSSETVNNIEWFEMKELRGHVRDNKVEHYQVVLKIGFRLD